MDAYPSDGLVPFPQDEYPPDWHDDGQAAHQLALERQERATEILRRVYNAWHSGQFTYHDDEALTLSDFRFLCAEMGLDWNDITRR